jgi:outer membrane protein assembly factor BamA
MKVLSKLVSLVFFIEIGTCNLTANEVFSAIDHNQSIEITSIEIQGNESTKKETLIEILPRELPAQMTHAEISEYSRRIKNLGIFEYVSVVKQRNTLLVNLRRKTTLSPIIDLTTGKSLEDTSAKFGLNEYDFLGTATKLGAQASYDDRNLNFQAWIAEHDYRNNRWARELEVYKLSSSFRFDESKDEWKRHRLGAAFEIVSPFRYDSPLLYEFQVQVYKETYSDDTTDKNQESAIYYGGLFEVIYDRYSWNDLHPDGFKGVVEMRPGQMDNGELRAEAVAKFIAATPVAKKPV